MVLIDLILDHIHVCHCSSPSYNSASCFPIMCMDHISVIEASQTVFQLSLVCFFFPCLTLDTPNLDFQSVADRCMRNGTSFGSYGRAFYLSSWQIFLYNAVGTRKRKQKFKLGGDKGGTPITILASSAIIACAGYV